MKQDLLQLLLGIAIGINENQLKNEKGVTSLAGR